MSIASYVVRRLGGAVLVLIGVTLIVFVLIHLVPGDPARTMLGSRATPGAVARLHEQWGLDHSLPEQYRLFVTRLLHGDLGTSLFHREAVLTLIADRLPPTLWLLGLGTLMAVVISVPLALIAVTAKDGIRDHVVRAIPLVGLGMPPFWVGIMLILVFGVELKLLPVGGYGQGFLGHLESLVLPSLTIALGLVPILVRSLRERLLDILESDYIAAARAKGLPERRVLFSHGLRNAASSTVTVLGLNISFLVGGTLVIEKVFAISGIGSFLFESIQTRDFAGVQGLTLVVAVLVIVVNLATDLAHAALDPRARART
jgi:peptide/nickel transport system permease protein